MATYWVDVDSPSEASPYDTQAKAAHTLATILAIPPAAGDVIYCCAGASVGETIAAELDIASSGTNADGFIKLIGCNSSGVVDGTRYIIDANSAGINCIDLNGHDELWFENIEVKSTGAGAYHGFYNSTGANSGLVFINCCANNCGGSGFSVINYSFFFRCVAYLNTSHGFNEGNSARYTLCASRDNSGAGWYFATSHTTCIGCVSHGNTDDGFSYPGLNSYFMNCVIDGNGDDGIFVWGVSDPYPSIVLGCRITNQSGAGDIGLDCSSESVVYGFNYFEDNNTNIANATIAQVIPLEGGSIDSNDADNADTNEGYAEAVANNNFATGYVDGTDPTLRRTAITIPWS